MQWLGQGIGPHHVEGLRAVLGIPDLIPPEVSTSCSAPRMAASSSTTRTESKARSTSRSPARTGLAVFPESTAFVVASGSERPEAFRYGHAGQPSLRHAHCSEHSAVINHLGHHVLVSVGLAAVGAACAHEPDGTSSAATSTNAVLLNHAAVRQVATARCRRLAECTGLGNRHTFADDAQCLEGDRHKDADLQASRDCPNGVDGVRLDVCTPTLADEYCDARRGALTVIPGCAASCTHMMK